MLRVFESIRFRLSLTIALVVFAVGAFLIGGSYLWQVNQLEDPQLNIQQVVVVNPRTGELTQTEFFTQGDLNQLAIEQIEVQTQRIALNELRKASFGALAVLFITSFGAGYLLSGWALRPVDRITRVAREITSTDLSRRINLTGPDDELQHMADTFDGMLDRVQDAFEDQRRFVHEASHELRNPLAVARTNLELALNSGDPHALKKGADIALRATDRMSVLVEDLLEQARQAIPELRRDSVDLGQLISEVAFEFKAVADQRNLTIEASPGDQATINGDGLALRRAVSNLVANAVRLAPEGSTIDLATSADGDCVLISVADEGPGIAPGDREAVFERFWRGNDPGSGSGLGLSIVRQIAERHGGTASVVSDEGRGSTFTLRIPAPLSGV